MQLPPALGEIERVASGSVLESCIKEVESVPYFWGAINEIPKIPAYLSVAMSASCGMISNKGTV